MLLFENSNMRAKMVGVRHLLDLRNTIHSQYRQNLFENEFYEERVKDFEDLSSNVIPNARSLIIVAYKDPPVHFSFTHGGKKVELLVPPTYLFAQRKLRKIMDVMAGALESKGHHIAQSFLPKKLLAVCSGLAEYGKNNITYVKGFGSYHRLVSFSSDLGCEQDEWREPVMMERCKSCKACTLNCPTGAINPERFLLHAERCLTYLDEKPKKVPFPAWVKKEWHNCLVGCMHCQSICPENKGMRGWIEEGEDFCEEETALLMSGKKAKELPKPLREKLTRCDLLDMLNLFPRNLSVFFE